MKAAVISAPETIELVTVSDPAPGPRDVVIAVAACGICGTDVHSWRGRPGATYPINSGHEYSGVVAEVGREVTRCVVGDRVAVHNYLYCGMCIPCKSGRPSFCVDRTFHREGWAEYVTIDQSTVHVIDGSLSLEAAALAEPLGACLNAVDVAALRSGETIAVFGAGPIGLGTLSLAMASGAALAVVVDPSEVRRDLALRMGATYALAPDDESLDSVVRQLTFGLGVDVGFDCVTRSTSFGQMLPLVRDAGSAIVVGNASPADSYALSLDVTHRRALQIKGSFSRGYVFPRVLTWLKRLDLSAMQTHRFPLDDVAAAVELAASAEAGKPTISF